MSASGNDQRAKTPAVWQWVTLCVGFLGVLAFALAHAPPGWHRPGPTAFWFSVTSGIIVGGVAALHHVRRRGLVFLVGFLVTAGAVAGIMGERYRMYDKSLRDLYLGPPAANPQTMREALKHGNVMEEMMQDIREDRQNVYEAKRPFPVFLTFRVEPLGITEEPWPLVFCLGEILIGGLIGAFVAIRWHAWQLEAQQTSSRSI